MNVDNRTISKFSKFIPGSRDGFGGRRDPEPSIHSAPQVRTLEVQSRYSGVDLFYERNLIFNQYLILIFNQYLILNQYLISNQYLFFYVFKAGISETIGAFRPIYIIPIKSD